MNITPPLAHLIDELAKLPTIGRKTAQRLAFHLIKRPMEEAESLSTAVLEARRLIRPCRVCCNYTVDEVCEVCADTRRDRSVICVVEQASDIYPFEKMGSYKGLYHVLGGALSPLDGVSQEDIRIPELKARLGDEVKEVIVATNSNSAGEITAMYLTKLIKPLGIAVTRIARGIPMGSELEYSDEVTLAKAFEDRIGV